MVLGMTMGIMQKFELASVHAHLNLLGWVSMALFGLIYHFYPQAGETKLAKVHFWIHNLAMPIFQVGLAMEIVSGGKLAFIVPIVIIASLITVIGILCFMVNILCKVK